MLVNVGGSGSSGSSLLADLLNRHPDICCGNELALFSKPVVYDDFQYLQKKERLIRLFGISNKPYSGGGAFLTNLDSYSIDMGKAWKWIRSSDGIVELADKFKQHILEQSNKSVWVEKTPANIRLVSKYLAAFPNAKFIHIVRDPRDVIISRMKRHGSLLSAATSWLTSIAAIQNHINSSIVLEIRYENLVLDFESSMDKICRHIGVEYSYNYFYGLSSHSDADRKSHRSWNATPDQPLTNKAIGRYKSSDIDFGQLADMPLTKEYADLLGVGIFTFGELAKKYGYDLHKTDQSEVSAGSTRLLMLKMPSFGLRHRLSAFLQRVFTDNVRSIPNIPFDYI